MIRSLWHAYRRWSIRSLRRKAERYRGMVAEFIASRQPQSDADFFAASMPDAPPEWIRWSIAIRWAIARLGRVHPRFVHSDDRFEDLMKLPGWCDRGDAFFDAGRLVILIEGEVDMSFRDEELERLPRVDSYNDLLVREFVQKAVELCARKAGPNPKSRHAWTRPEGYVG